MAMQQAEDSRWMLFAISMAYRGRGLVEPNPMVGCVIVKNSTVKGRGYHQRFGGDHAEVIAILDAGGIENIEGSTVYVTLEPCSHFGKTPPCVDLLIKARPARVVVGIGDPYPEVAGKGILALIDAGIEVDVGIERDECEKLLKPYLKRVVKSSPWIIAKWAMTMDGRLATSNGSSRWISNSMSRNHAHRVRSCVDALMVGVGTVIADDPLLTVRLNSMDLQLHDDPKPESAFHNPMTFEGDKATGMDPGYVNTSSRKPIRVVMDRNARTPIGSKILDIRRGDPETWIVVGPAAANNRCSEFERKGASVIRSRENSIEAMMSELSHVLIEKGVTNLLVDGGATIVGSLFDAQIVDETHIYVAGKLVGGAPCYVPNSGTGSVDLARAVSLERIETSIFEDDIFVRSHCRYGGPSNA